MKKSYAHILITDIGTLKRSKLNNDSHFESIYPIAVTGIVKNGNQILLGKRGKMLAKI